MLPQSMTAPSGSADALATAQDALGPYEKDDDEDGERRDAPDLRRDDQDRHLHQQADDECTDEGAERGAEATERDRREDEQQDLLAHREAHLLEAAEQDPGEPGERGAGDPDDPDDALHI